MGKARAGTAEELHLPLKKDSVLPTEGLMSLQTVPGQLSLRTIPSEFQTVRVHSAPAIMERAKGDIAGSLFRTGNS